MFTADQVNTESTTTSKQEIAPVPEPIPETPSTPETTQANLIRCSLFHGCKDNTPTHLNSSWKQLTSKACLRRAFKSTGSTKEEAKQKLPAFSPAAYSEGKLRSDQNVESIQIFMLDFDNKAEQPTGEFKENGEPVFEKVAIPGAPTKDEVSAHITSLGFTHFLHDSMSSTPENERFRIAFPLDEPSDGKNWKVVSEWLLAQLKMDHWRSMGCIDLGALHRAACIYFTAGYWDQEPEAKERIRFVSFDGTPLALPTAADLEGFVVPPTPTHPLRAEWAQKMAAQHAPGISGSAKELAKALNVDYKTLDAVGFFEAMGSTVQAPRIAGKGFKAPCTCPFASEHTNGKDNGDAVIFYGDGRPKFKCMHDVHKDMSIEDVCVAAGVDMVQRFAKPYRVATRPAKKAKTNEVIEPEIVDDSAEAANADKASERRRQKFEAMLEADNIDPKTITFTERGGIANSISNAEHILRSGNDTMGLIRQNELRRIREIDLEECVTLAADDYDNRMTALLIGMQRKWQAAWSFINLERAVNYIAGKNAFHPVQDWFEALPGWDQVDRINLIRDEVLGVNQTPDFDKYQDLYATMLRYTLIAAVRRIFEPGCKMDTVTMLFSAEQGAGKSSFWRMLCADPSWFNDSRIQIDSVEGYKVLGSFWIHEMGEIDDMTSKKSAEAIKTFVSSPADNYRGSYERTPRLYPRRCIIVGSTNKEEVLNDPTGSRRFWVIPTAPRLNLELLPSHLDQIWAQALHLYRAGEPHWLSRELDIRREKQSKRFNMVNRFAGFMPHIINWYLTSIRPNGVTTNEIFAFLDEGIKGASQRNSGHQREMCACLRIHGWTEKRVKVCKNSLTHWTPPAEVVTLPSPASVNQAMLQVAGFSASAFPGLL